MELPPVVLDIGSGYSKVGYAGNAKPMFTMPTCVANHVDQASVHRSVAVQTCVGSADMNYYVGEAGYNKRHDSKYVVRYPIGENYKTDWDQMERFLSGILYRYLKCTPDDHYFLMSEVPMNPVTNKERCTEVMFETFNVKGLHYAQQPVLAMYGNAVQGDASGCANITSRRVNQCSKSFKMDQKTSEINVF